MATDPQVALEFGQFTLVPTEKRLLCDGTVVPLAPKVFDTLVLLVKNQGRLIEKEELLKALWPHSVVEESAHGWREYVNCPLECGPNQQYSDCVGGCQPTCADKTVTTVCDRPCFEGCVCSNSTVLDGTGLKRVVEALCRRGSGRRIYSALERG